MPTDENPDFDPFSAYSDVRALGRGLRLLEVLAEIDGVAVSDLAKRADIDRSTTYRLLGTLMRAGYIDFQKESGVVSLSPKLQMLSQSIRSEEPFLPIVRDAIDELTRQIMWPSDFALLRGGKLLILASSHRLSPMTVYRRLVGQTRSITRSALGLSILGAMSPRKRATLYDFIRAEGGPEVEDLDDPRIMATRLAAVTERGFALSVGMIDPRVTGIALPVALPGREIGAVNIVAFSRAVRTDTAALRLIPHLRACVARIEKQASEHAP